MATLEYSGSKAGYAPYFGKVTKRLYRFGKAQTINEVEDADVQGLLDTMEGKRRVFDVIDITTVEVPDASGADGPVQPTQAAGTGDASETVEIPIEAKKDVPAPAYDFTVLSGVGTSRNETLHSAGILTASDFLAATDQRIADLLGVGLKTVGSWRKRLMRES